MNILVLGRDGQLGQSLHDRLPSAYPSSVFWDRQTLDLEQLDDIVELLVVIIELNIVVIDRRDFFIVGDCIVS